MNLFGITSIIIFFASIGFGLFLFSSNRTSKINQSWFLVSICTSLWGLALYGVTSTANIEIAKKWQYLLDISATLIPVSYLLFVCNFLNIQYFWIRRAVLYTGAALAVFTVTPLFKEGMVLKYGFYWINPGPYYDLFPIFFLVTTLISLFFLIQTYLKTKHDLVLKAQIRNTLIAGLIGFSGGFTNFFPQVINVYPFGNYFVLLYLFFMSYGVLKYKLLSTKIISAQLFSGAIFLVFLFNLLQPSSLGDWLIKFLLFSLVSFFSVFLVRGVYKEIEQREKIELLAKDLETANEQQTNLIHFISHEVKGFLSKSRNIFSMFSEEDYGPLPAYLKKPVQEGFESATKGVGMIQEILNASNLKKGTIQYNMMSFDFTSLVFSVFADLKTNAEQKGLAFFMHGLEHEKIPVFGDAEQVKHAVRNLIDNSIKYTLSGSIHVFLEKRNDNVLLSVKDTGVGITEEDKARLFTEGGRGRESVKVNVDSTGYGLFISKKIILSHGGKIWAESEGKGKGSTFYIELPVK